MSWVPFAVPSNKDPEVSPRFQVSKVRLAPNVVAPASEVCDVDAHQPQKP